MVTLNTGPASFHWPGLSWYIKQLRKTRELLTDYAVCLATEVDATLEAIRATDTTRPDGAIARGLEGAL